jgi:hypothetical protein
MVGRQLTWWPLIFANKTMPDFPKKIRLTELLKEAFEGAEHNRLKADLKSWAQLRGFVKEYSQLPDDSEPDALFVDSTNSFLFVGDAKNAENEKTGTSATVSRIINYTQWFAKLLGNPYLGGIIALATNDEKEAVKWAVLLNVLAEAAGISSTLPPKDPDFKIEHYADKTWIVFW